MFDDLKPIAIFSETADQGSFRKAAEILGLSPSVVSYHITQLEARLGVTLFYRTTRKLSLTHEGEILHERAKEMVAAAKAGLNDIAYDKANPFGKLKLSIPQFLIRSSFMDQVAGFKKQYPKIALDISCTDERDDIVQEGIDLAIRAGSMSDSNFKSKRILEVKRVLVCSPDYLSGRGRPQHPQDLQEWDWISLKMLPQKRELSFQDQREVVAYQSSVAVNSVDLLAEFSLRGLGLSTPPDFLVKDYLAAGTLIEVLPDWRVSNINVYAVWPGNVQTSSAVSEFLHYISEFSDNR